LRPAQDLMVNLAAHLRRTETPFDGMTYSFTIIDPENRLCEHVFLFLVLYGQAEETLHVVNVGYARFEGV
jgi:hypothetical protein